MAAGVSTSATRFLGRSLALREQAENRLDTTSRPQITPSDQGTFIWALLLGLTAPIPGFRRPATTKVAVAGTTRQLTRPSKYAEGFRIPSISAWAPAPSSENFLGPTGRSEEHTPQLPSPHHLPC